jgi:ketosteroid isomerase-like protein
MGNAKLTTRCRTKIVCVLALAGALAMPVLAQDKSGDESKVIPMEKAWNQAYKSRDGKALGSILQDSIVLVNDDGSLQSRNEFLTGIDMAKPFATQQDNPESIKVRFFGDVAIATGVSRLSGVEDGKAFVRRDRFVDTWIHKGNSWQCVAASAPPILR